MDEFENLTDKKSFLMAKGVSRDTADNAILVYQYMKIANDLGINDTPDQITFAQACIQQEVGESVGMQLCEIDNTLDKIKDTVNQMG